MTVTPEVKQDVKVYEVAVHVTVVVRGSSPGVIRGLCIRKLANYFCSEFYALSFTREKGSQAEFNY